MTLLRAALDYAGMGWPVFPVYGLRNGRCACGSDCGSPAKHPLRELVPNGLKNATVEADWVHDWWQRFPSANIGLRTGDAFDVLDVDGDEGAESMRALLAAHGALPAGPRSRTGGGGRHLLFAPTGIGNRAGVVTKVDWRGRGGYIVAPPSVHISGRAYKWLNGPEKAAPEAPAWLRAVLDPPKPPRRPEGNGRASVHYLAVPGQGTRYGVAALEAELDELGRAVEGTRNAELNLHAFNLFQLVAGGELDEGFVASRLEAVAAHIGLGGHEITQTIDSARRGGLAQPRYAPPLPERMAVNGSTTTPRPARELEGMEVIRPFARIPVDLTVAMEQAGLLTSWLYGAGCLTVLQSEPGVGKSWLALWLSLRVMEAGGDVIYVDEEGGIELVHERLCALGADPAMVAEHFWYYAFETRRWDDEDLHALRTMLATVPRPALAVLDSLPDFLAVADQDEDRAKDVTRFIKRVCGAFREVGCAQLLLDHLPKPERGSKRERSRYSRGSGAKLGKADATLLLESEVEFDARTSGKLRLWKTKDRRGRLVLPALGKPGRLLAVTVGDGSVRIEEAEDDASRADWRPTHRMEQVSRAVELRPEGVSRNGIRSVIPGDNSTIDAAIEFLVGDGYLHREKVGQAHMHTVIRPYREPADEPIGPSCDEDEEF